jgi:ATP-binding cassette subfamily F protein 3
VDLAGATGHAAIVGGPRSGKTTLLRTMVGEVPPLSGQARLGHKVTINYYAQAHEGLEMNATVLEEIRRIKPLIKETEARTLLGRFLFSGDDVYKRVGDLSGGERSRVALAQLTLMGGNLLVLDEPTNHLDIGAREALEVVLNEYNGSILFVSHDRYFIDRLATRVWAVKDEQVQTYLRNNTDYQPQLGRRPEPAPEPPKEEPVTEPVPSEPSNGRRPRRQADDARLQKSLSQVERDVGRLEGKLNELSDALAVASIDEDVEAVARLGAEYERVQTELEDAYADWEDLTAQLEAMAGPPPAR